MAEDHAPEPVTVGPDIPRDNWADGDAYESYVGRWSRPVAREFIRWLNLPSNQRWLDVGCGTGALSDTILSIAHPIAVKGIDPSSGFLSVARKNIPDSRFEFAVGSAQSIPEPSSSYDAAVSGLVLNFVPQPLDAVREMTRVVRPGGTVAVYVWDYAEKMELMRTFWDAATALDPAATELDEGKRRFPICNPDSLSDLFTSAGLRDVETCVIQVPTPFRNFNDYWLPFLAGQGPAGGYVASLSPERRAALRDRLQTTLPIQPSGSIDLVAGAWAIRGIVQR
jgi:SAM-dependent methyltransferase